MRRTDIFYSLTTFFLFFIYTCAPIFGSGDDDDFSEPTYPLSEKGWVYGHIEYEHDLLTPNLYFMKLLAHPESEVPLITGGYTSTDVDVPVLLRGIDPPRAMHDASERHRPHVWRDRERERWDAAMAYVWNLTDPTHTFRVHNMKVIDVDVPTLDIERAIEADVEFYLGGQWHNLAIAMMQDEHARPLQNDGSRWDPGSKEFSLENPNNPR